MSNQNDEQIIAQIVSGDVDAYKELYHRYASSVLGLSYRIVGNRGQAEEIMQETFWRVWQNASSFWHNQYTSKIGIAKAETCF